MPEELIHKMLEGDLSDFELKGLRARMEQDRAVRDDVFAYHLLESELHLRYHPPVRIRVPSTRHAWPWLVFAAAGVLVLLAGSWWIKTMLTSPPPGPDWHRAVVDRELASIKDETKPTQKDGGPGGRGGEGAPGGDQKGGNAKGGEDTGGPGKIGRKAGAPPEPDLRAFAKQFSFRLGFPRNVPGALALIRAKKIAAAPTGPESDTALLIYADKDRKLFVFEDTHTEMISRPQNLAEETRWRQTVSGPVRITLIGVGFTPDEWDALVKSTQF